MEIKWKVSLLAAVLAFSTCCMDMQHTGVAKAEEMIEVTQNFALDESAVMEQEYQKEGICYELVSQNEEDITRKVKEEVRQKKKVQLFADDASLVPETMEYTKDGVSVDLKLDRNNISIEESETEKKEQKTILDREVVYKNLPDNDIDRLKQHITHKGKTLDLISVSYDVEERKNGIPVSYAAACYYACVETEETEVATAWEATAWYEGIWEKEVVTGTKVTAVYREKEISVPEPEPEKEINEKKEIVKEKAPEKKKMAAAAAPAAVIVVLAGFWMFPNVKIYSLVKGEKTCYKRIAMVKARKKRDGWHLKIRKADEGAAFKILCSAKLLKKAAADDFYVNGRKIPSPDSNGESVFCL